MFTTMEINCPICHESIDLAQGSTLDHRCGCYTHAKCHVGIPDPRPRCPVHVPDSEAAKHVKAIEEPVGTGPDWITAPPTSGALAKIRNAWLNVKDMNKNNPEDISNPFTLLSMKKPIEWMIRVKKLGLKDMYDAGVTLKDFLENGYTITDLCTYRDIGKMGPQRGLAALLKLGLNADLLLDQTDKLPLEVMRKRFQLTSADICRADDTLQFHPQHGLREDWSVDNLVYLGLTFKDLQRYCGLKMRHHWDALEATQEHMQALKCASADINLLVSNLIDVGGNDEPEKEPTVTVGGSAQMQIRTYVPPQPAKKNQASGARKLKLLK